MSMISNSHINQARCIEWGITLNQGALLDFLIKLSIYQDAGEDYMPVNRGEIAMRLPVLFNRADTVYRTLKELSQKNLIEYVPIGESDELSIGHAVTDFWFECMEYPEFLEVMQSFSDDMQHSPDGYTQPASNRKVKQSISNRIKKAVFERDKYRCQACDTHLNLSVDHIVPESKGGESVMSNFQTLCLNCNRSKGVKTMSEWQGDNNESA